MIRTVRSVAAATLGVPALLLIGAAPAAAATATCELVEPGVLRVTASDSGMVHTVSAVPDPEENLVVQVKDYTDDVPCLNGEDPFFVADLTSIQLADGGSSWFQVDQSRPFARSATPGDAVELHSVQTNGSMLSIAQLEGAATAGWTVLNGEPVPSVNLDADLDADADLRVFGTLSLVLVQAGQGNDVLNWDNAGTSAWPFPTQLDGESGDDIITGGDDVDTLVPGEGNDFVDSGLGADTVYAWPDDGDDTLVIGAEQDTLDLQGGNVPGVVRISLDGVANDGASDGETAFESDNFGRFAKVLGSEGDDLYVNTMDVDPPFDFGVDDFDGRGGRDTVTYAGQMFGNSITVGPLTGQPGWHEVDPAGNQQHDVDRLGHVETFVGTDWADLLDTVEPDIEFRAGLGDDVVNSHGPRTVLVADPAPDGADTFQTADGQGVWDYSARTTPVSVTFDVTDDDGAALEGDLVMDSEIAKVIGGSAADKMWGDSSFDQLVGGAGNDYLNGRGGGDILAGDAGADTLLGGSGDDQINGGGDDDTLIGGAGDDRQFGDSGADTHLEGNNGVPNGSDRLVGGGGGLDTVSYAGRTAGVVANLDGLYGDGASDEDDRISSDVDTLLGGEGSDVLTGNGFGNTLRGNGGNDVLDGGLGGDLETGGAGNDTFLQGRTALANGADQLYGEAGSDTVSYLGRSAGVKVSLDNLANDGATGEADRIATTEKVVGTTSGDTLTGGGLADLLYGNGGADTIRGGGGTDTIDGGAQSDKMYGDAGNDRFYAKDSTKDTVSGGTGTDKARRDAIDALTSIEGTF